MLTVVEIKQFTDMVLGFRYWRRWLKGELSPNGLYHILETHWEALSKDRQVIGGFPLVFLPRDKEQVIAIYEAIGSSPYAENGDFASGKPLAKTTEWF